MQACFELSVEENRDMDGKMFLKCRHSMLLLAQWLEQLCGSQMIKYMKGGHSRYFWKHIYFL